MSTTKLGHGDDHDTTAGADPEAVKRGYEEDIVDTGAIWSIPFAVGAFIALGLVVATGTFIYFMTQQPNPNANPFATVRNDAPLSERLGRIGRAGAGTELKEQPRLDGLVRREKDGLFTSQKPLANGNAPELHPEDLRATSEKQKQLQTGAWLNEQKTAARIPIADAMKLAMEAKMFPVRKDPVNPLTSNQKATSANAGRGGLPVAPAPKEAHDDHKHK